MELQKQAPQPQGLMPQAISDELKFEIARRDSKKIIESSEEEIRQALRYAMVKIGLRAANFPEGIEKLLLIQHVYENFPNNTVEEIKICFDWAISGRIGEDFNCYENFSCAYFSRMMNAYNRLASAVKLEPQEYKQIKYMIEERAKEMPYDRFLETPFAKQLIKNGIEIPAW